MSLREKRKRNRKTQALLLLVSDMEALRTERERLLCFFNFKIWYERDRESDE
jgi:hypothetical protein